MARMQIVVKQAGVYWKTCQFCKMSNINQESPISDSMVVQIYHNNPIFHKDRLLVSKLPIRAMDILELRSQVYIVKLSKTF